LNSTERQTAINQDSSELIVALPVQKTSLKVHDTVIGLSQEHDAKESPQLPGSPACHQPQVMNQTTKHHAELKV